MEKLHVAIIAPHNEAFLNFNCLLPTWNFQSNYLLFSSLLL